MKSHFSVLSANVRPEIGEKISIGLILISKNKLFFKFSKDKINVTKELLSSATQKYLKDIVKQISNEVDRYNSETNLFTNSDLKTYTTFLDRGYIDYLNRYSNSILNFTSPKQIDKAGDEQLFSFLFRKYIDANSPNIDRQNKKDFDVIKPLFYEKVKNQFDIEKEFSSNEIPNLPVSIKIDMIGKNEKIVYAQSVDLERGPYHIQNDVGIITTLNQVYSNKAKSYIISSEPDKIIYPKQYQIWLNLKNNTIAEYVDISEIEKIKQYADEHNVRPLIESSETLN